MSSKSRLHPLATTVLLALPLLVIAFMIWALTGLFPSCSISEHERIASPDDRHDIVVFSRSCGASTPPNSQAALVPHGEALGADTGSFISIGQAGNLAPRWDAYGNIELTLPETVEIFAQADSVAGISVIYR